jgi:hypothetical protein
VDTPAEGKPQLRREVAPERRVTIEEAEMRHGRKRRRQRIASYKRPVLRDVESGLVRAVGVTPANALAASVTEALMAARTAQAVTLQELPIDQAYLSSALVRERPAGLASSEGVAGAEWHAVCQDGVCLGVEDRHHEAQSHPACRQRRYRRP